MKSLQSTRDVSDLIAESHHQPVFIFKNSPYCSISYLKWETFLYFVKDHPDLRYAKIDVIEQRELSNFVAEQTGVRHQSPQVLAFAKGNVIWHASHWNIEEDALIAALRLCEEIIQKDTTV